MELLRVRRWKTALPGGQSRGQSFVELAMTLPMVISLLMGIVDAGFVFYAHVQAAAACGEAANVGSRMALDSTDSQADNDAARNSTIAATAVGALGKLNPSLPNFDPSSTHYVEVAYQPSTSADRIGEPISVTLRYRQKVLFNVLPNLLPGGYFEVSTTTQARIQ